MEKLIAEILAAMQDALTPGQLQKLENVLVIKTHGVVLQKEHTELIVSERHWEKALRLYLASKRLENCSEGTLEQYGRCIRMLMQALNKRLQEITSQENWKPGMDTASLWTRIDLVHAGNLADPIPWKANMQPEAGKYYHEGNLTAKCVEDPGQPLYNALADLCPGRYFEAA